MTLHHSAGEQKASLLAAERRLTEIALLMRKVFPALSWEREILHSPYRNILNVEMGGRHVVVPFTDRELRSHSRALRVRALDHRMYVALEELFDTCAGHDEEVESSPLPSVPWHWALTGMQSASSMAPTHRRVAVIFCDDVMTRWNHLPSLESN